MPTLTPATLYLADLSNVALESDNCPSGMQTWPIRRHKRKASRGPELPVLNQLPVSVTFDMRLAILFSSLKDSLGVMSIYNCKVRKHLQVAAYKVLAMFRNFYFCCVIIDIAYIRYTFLIVTVAKGCSCQHLNVDVTRE